MAYSPSEKYPGAVDSDPNYQGGKFRDNNPSTTNNGSPLKAIDRNELLARDEAIMNDAGFEYSGVADTPQDSQLFQAYKASLGNGANLLSNHNFLIQTPDESQPLPSAAPTSYPPGYQIFSGVFANETTGITNLTYIDGRVSFSGGDLYFSVPNSNGLEKLTEFAASVADFDGNPRQMPNSSWSLVGDDYRVTVGVADLAGGPLGSVKFEQGSVATGHEVEYGVVAAGSTTPRVLSDRFADVVNVKDFGAVGDGGTDDTDAIQAAISATGGKVFFPSGTYLCGEVTVRRGITLEGEQREETVIVCRDQYFVNWVWDGSGATQLKYFNVLNMTFDQTREVANHITFKLWGSLHNNLSNLTFRGVGPLVGATGLCISLRSAYFDTYRDIQCENTGYGIWLNGESFYNGPNQNYFQNINLNNITEWGIRLDYSRGNHFEGVDAEYGNSLVVKNAFRIFNSSYNKISHFWYEALHLTDPANAEPAISIDASSVSNNKGNIIEWSPQIINGNVGISVTLSQDTRISNVRVVGGGTATGVKGIYNTDLVIEDNFYDNVLQEVDMASSTTTIRDGSGFNLVKRNNAQFSIDSQEDGYNQLKIRSQGNDKFVVSSQIGSDSVNIANANGAFAIMQANQNLSLYGGMQMLISIPEGDVTNNTLFQDGGVLKWKDASGVVIPLT